MSGTDLRYAQQNARYLPTLCRYAVCGIRLHACYAMSGTDLACGATCLRAYYAMCGTALAYGTAWSGAMSVLTCRMALRDVQY
eukprot:3941737-Rhodomonas_salina.11